MICRHTGQQNVRNISEPRKHLQCCNEFQRNNSAIDFRKRRKERTELSRSRHTNVSKADTAIEGRGGKVLVKVVLDLRSAKPGDYFLVTIRGTDNGAYYCPLKIQ